MHKSLKKETNLILVNIFMFLMGFILGFLFIYEWQVQTLEYWGL